MRLDELSGQHFDLVVVGTGLVEAIVVFFAASEGKSVLQLERSTHYAPDEGTFSLKQLSGGEVELRNFSLQVNDASFFEKHSRALCVDLRPQLLQADDDMCKLLLASSVSAYLEFVPVEGVFWQHVQDWRRFPLTKECIFREEGLSLAQRRGAMKLLHALRSGSCTQVAIDAQPDFLKSALNLVVLDQDADAAIDATSHETRRRILQFVASAGIFGKSPFLYCCNGSSDVAHGFIRMAAVKGATQCLGVPQILSTQCEDGRFQVRCSDCCGSFTADAVIDKIPSIHCSEQRIAIGENRALPDDGVSAGYGASSGLLFQQPVHGSSGCYVVNGASWVDSKVEISYTAPSSYELKLRLASLDKSFTIARSRMFSESLAVATRIFGLLSSGLEQDR